MKRFVIITGTAATGVGIMIVAFVYDLFYAGIPYQDPPPDLQARWELNKSIADMIYLTGGVIALLGILAVPVLWVVTGRKKHQQSLQADAGDDDAQG